LGGENSVKLRIKTITTLILFYVGIVVGNTRSQKCGKML